MAKQPLPTTNDRPTAPQSKQFKRRFGITLALLAYILGVALISRYVLIHQSLRLDEAQSMWQTSHSFGFTLRVVAEDVHVPLYHVILHFWQLYFGHGVATVRLLSLLFFMATIPLMYILSRQILSTRWSLFATFIFSFMPFMNWYANEGRMYTLLAFMATLSQIYFLRIIQRRPAWRGYALSSVVGAYSHYFFSFNLASQAVFYLTNRKKFAAGSFKRFLVVAILVAAALAPWLIYFHTLGSAKNTAPKLNHPSTVDFFNAFSQFFFGFQDNHVNTILVSCWPLLVLVAFFAIKRGQQLTQELSYIISAAFVPIIIAFLLSFIVNPFFLSRYMISCVGPLVILTVWLISNYSRKLSLLASLLLIGVLALSSVQQAESLKTPVKEDYQAVATTINQEVQPQDVVVLSAPFTVYPFEYYYTGSAQIQTLPIWDREASGAIPAFNKATLPTQVKQLNTSHHYVYLVLSQNQGYENDIRQYYLHNFKQVSSKTYSPGLSLYVFQVGYDTVPALGTGQAVMHAQ